MKLKSTFITEQIDDSQFLIAVGDDSFSGIIRNNKTAAFIVDMLKTETTEEQIVDAMFAKYEAPREVIQKDVLNILNGLRRIRALEE